MLTTIIYIAVFVILVFVLSIAVKAITRGVEAKQMIKEDNNLESSKIENLQNSFIQKKKKDQPSRVKTCGSTFKNPKGEKAWQLIRKTGSSKFVVGDARISEQHSNFFVNNCKAKASDIEELINKVKKNVLEKSGVTLSLEIKIIGDK